MTSQLEMFCKTAYDIQYEVCTTDARENISQFIECVRETGEMIGHAMPQTAQSITDFITGLNRLQPSATQKDRVSPRCFAKIDRNTLT